MKTSQPSDRLRIRDVAAYIVLFTGIQGAIVLAHLVYLAECALWHKLLALIGENYE